VVPHKCVEEREMGPRPRIHGRGCPGSWEENGYHMYGDPFKEQRFSGE
jgi:DMSO/TMAO reductase YedYZ molybdopterin-dependent catalytic subunit